MLVTGHIECVHRGVSVSLGSGSAAGVRAGGSQRGAMGSGQQDGVLPDRTAYRQRCSQRCTRPAGDVAHRFHTGHVDRRRPRPEAGSTCCCFSRSSFSGPTACSISRLPGCRSSTAWCAGFLLAADIPTVSALTGEANGWLQPSRDSYRRRNHRRGSTFAFDRLLDRCALPCQCSFVTAGLPALHGHVADGLSA